MHGGVAAGWTELGKSKLESSGLTLEIGKQLGMREAVSAAQLHPGFDARPALVIPYFDIERRPLAAHKQWPDFYRIRYLQKGTDFKSIAEDKERRYAQPPATGVCAYFPKIADWKALAKDVTKPIFITEGELKAAAACFQGYDTIGLGGVCNFRSTSMGHFFLPELQKIEWCQRTVHIVFDSDYATNPNICAAIGSLAQELEERGAIPHVIGLPQLVEGHKTGLDDFFMAEPVEAFEELIGQAEPLGMTRALWQVNKEVMYAEDPGIIIVDESGQKMAPGHFKEHSRWSTASTVQRKINSEGTVTLHKVPASQAWIKWPMRRSVKGLTYVPGAPRITDEGEYNQWPGWGVKPVEGDVKPFEELVKFLFKDMETTSLTWFLDWLAYPLQNPGVKMFSAVVMHSVVQGTGKSLMGYTMGEIYGKNFKEIKDSDIGANFNQWAENRQFVMGDEITGNDNRQHADALKRLITQRTVEINVKHLPQYTVPDCINYFFTSNHCDAFFLEDTDRRFMVVEVVGQPLDNAFYERYDKWLWEEKGASALFHWLLKRKISKHFRPAAPAPHTAAKERMILSGKGDLTMWVRELLENPQQKLFFGKMSYTRDLFTSKELLRMYESQFSPGKVTSVGMGRALAAAGCPIMDGGKPLRAPDGAAGRYYAVRNLQTWARCKDRKTMEKNIALQPITGGTK
jgi:hypothetical protein